MAQKTKTTVVKKKKHEKRKLGRNGMAAEAKRDLCNYSRRTFPWRFHPIILGVTLGMDLRDPEIDRICAGNIPDVTLPCTLMQR